MFLGLSEDLGDLHGGARVGRAAERARDHAVGAHAREIPVHDAGLAELVAAHERCGARAHLLHADVALFLRLDFYERPGALHDFLAKRLTGNANLIYFNYRHSGERIGRALIGIEFPSPFERDAFLMAIPPQGEGYRLCEPLDDAAASRLAFPCKT